MHVAARVRLVLARRPWIYWSIVAMLAAVAAVAVHAQLHGLERARRSWGETRPVLVAVHAAEPGDTVPTRTVDVPVALVPDDALTEWPPGATLRRRIGPGEVLTGLDTAGGTGPAALADPGTVVVPLADPWPDGSPVGTRVGVAAEGVMVTASAVVVGRGDGVILIAVDPSDAPAVAAAGHQGIASVLYLP